MLYVTALKTAPMIVALNVSSPYFIFVLWDPPSITNGVICHYNLYVDYENGTVDTFYVEGQFTSYNITDLLPFQTIRIKISANSSIGEGPHSPQVVVQTAQTCKLIPFA